MRRVCFDFNETIILDNPCCSLILILEALSGNWLSCASFSCRLYTSLMLFLDLTLVCLCFSRRSRYDIKISELLTTTSIKQSLLQNASSVSKPGQSFFKTRLAFSILKVSPIFLLHFGRCAKQRQELSAPLKRELLLLHLRDVSQI